MINKISGRSECFDIFAAKMAPKAISKRAAFIPIGLSSSVEHGFELLKDLANAGKASKSFNVSIGQDALKAVSNPEAKAGLLVLEKRIDSKTLETLEQSLVAISKSDEAQKAVLSSVKGYYPVTKYEEFIAEWSKDMIAMRSELEQAAGKMTTAELEAFHIKYKKPIDVYKILSESKALQPESVAAAAAKAATKPATTKAPQTAEEVAAAAKEKAAEEAAIAAKVLTPAERAAKAGAALAIGKGVGGLALLGGIGYFGVQTIKSVLFAPEGKDELSRVNNAIDCIKAIGLVSGSPAAVERDVIIGNIKAYTSPTSIESLNAARTSLSGSAGVTGSIANFVYLITQDPQTNLSGYVGSPNQSTGAAALGGAAIGGSVGFGLGGPIPGLVGAAIGAAIVGFAGYNFVTSRYSDQINCIVGAVDAMKVIDGMMTKAGAMNPSDQQPEGFHGPLETASPEASILAKILVAMSENKLVGKRGLDFVNEKKLVVNLLERATSPEIAAVALIKSNYNIATRVKSDTIQNIVGAIDKGAVRANQELKDLMQDIIATAPNAMRALEQGQIKTSNILHTRENNMKKASISTNTGTIKKKAEETKASYFGDASSGLSDSLTKSYYAGLTGMYNEKLPSRSSDYKDLYGFQEETGGDLVLQSHSKSVTLADAMGKGGLVENGLEQQEKSHYIATSTPSGNFQSKYAQTLNYLTKLAKAADDQGKKDVSKLINQTIKTLN